MKTRREFLSQATVTLLMIPLAAACSSSNDSSSPSGSSSGGGSCDGVDTTSTSVSEHTHTLCVPTSDLTSPPSGGMTYTSSNVVDPINNQLHTHTVTLSAQQLSSIQAGQQVTVTASTSDSHTHDFMIRGPAT